MVCSKCESKLAKLAAPDPFKDGSRNSVIGGGRDGGRPINENKALTSAKRARTDGYGSACSVCKSSLHQHGLFCNKCAYAKGVCSMCGIQILDTTMYRQSGGGNPEADAKRRDAAAARAAEEAANEGAKQAVWASQAAEKARLVPGPPSGPPPARPTPPPAPPPPPPQQQQQHQQQQARPPVPPQALPQAQSLPQSAHAAAAELATASVAPRYDPSSLAAAVAAKSSLVGGTLSSSLGAAGRPLSRPAADAGAPPPGWPFNPASGLYYDVPSQTYWSPATKLFFDCTSGVWSKEQKGAPKQRVVDRWGL